MTEKWGEIQGKMDLVRVSRKFKLSGFYCSSTHRLQSAFKNRVSLDWMYIEMPRSKI